ncbi:hypothetical protein [Lichenicoccus sp.]|uniref:hypothetical protein n=1 Tax=Lichenicoccus sp. TaxID=2781899 RepID=UPI003D09C62F
MTAQAGPGGSDVAAKQGVQADDEAVLVAHDLASRSPDIVSITDFTAGYSPAGNDNAAVQAAIIAASNSGGRSARLLWFSPGNYNLTQTQYSQGNDAEIVPEGAEFTGLSFPPGMTDGSVLQDGGTALALGKVMDSGKGSGHGGHTTLFVGAVNRAYASGVAKYEHDAAYINLYNYDPSQFRSGRGAASYIPKDAVSLHVAASLAPGTGNLGRIWGIEDNVQIVRGAGDGIADGIEIGMDNWSGSASGEPGSYTSKTGVNIWAGGNANSTSAINIGSSASRVGWEDGIDASGVTRRFLRLSFETRDVFLVSSKGDLTAASAAILGHATFAQSMNVNGFIIRTLHRAISSTGSALATATALTAHYNTVRQCATGAVRLPLAVPDGGDVYILNRCSKKLDVYPGSSATRIEAGSAGAAITLAAGATGHFMRESSDQWRQI